MSLAAKDSWLSHKDSAGRGGMSSAAVLRRVYGRHAAKVLAREHQVSPSATKKWLAGEVPAARAGRVVAQARLRLDRRLDELAELEAELDRIAGDYRRLIDPLSGSRE